MKKHKLKISPNSFHQSDFIWFECVGCKRLVAIHRREKSKFRGPHLTQPVGGRDRPVRASIGVHDRWLQKPCGG